MKCNKKQPGKARLLISIFLQGFNLYYLSKNSIPSASILLLGSDSPPEPARIRDEKTIRPSLEPGSNIAVKPKAVVVFIEIMPE